MVASIIVTACGVAEVRVLPVDVLMKSAPAAIAKWAARSIKIGSTNSPVSRMTFNRLGSGTTLRIADNIAMTVDSSPRCSAAYGNTRSISSAPAFKASTVSLMVTATSPSPPGKLTTVATWIGESINNDLESPTNLGQTQTAAM